MLTKKIITAQGPQKLLQDFKLLYDLPSSGHPITTVKIAPIFTVSFKTTLGNFWYDLGEKEVQNG